jgi:hypothetical protein
MGATSFSGGAIDLIAVEDDEAAREEAGAAVAFAARLTGGIDGRSTFL